MNILTMEHIRKLYGEKVIFDNISYGIHEGDKIGIIGINGTGKTTLLRILAGLEEPDEGQVITKNGLRITYLPQDPVFRPGIDMLSYVAGGIRDKGWTRESEARAVLNRLGLTNHEQSLESLSGGQKKRAALARTLVNPTDVLILDEPTNHLDNTMTAWLEEYLGKFKGVVVMVTHDRYFLDRVTNKILEISHGKLYSYTANYSKFLELKAEREEMEQASERKRQSILRMELEWAKRGCRARTTKQKARLERLEALKNGQAPRSEQTVALDSVETRMGKKTIELTGVSKSYGEHRVITDFSYIVLRNQRLGIIGPNGCGKSTLMNLLAGIQQPDSGCVEVGETIRIGYLAQQEQDMDGRQRVIDAVREIAEYVPTREGRITASQMLERFLFDATLQYTPVSKLSGGEKRRLYLLKVLMSAPNVLLLDEPTNDLDIPTLTILEDYLDSFAGIVITVSHDRYFLDHVVDRIFAFEEGRLQQYEGGYSDYLAARSQRESSVAVSGGSGKTAEKKTAARDWKQKRPVKLKFSYQEEREYAVIEDEIAALEESVAGLEEQMQANATNSLRLGELIQEKEAAEAALEAKMERWVYLNELAERIAQEDQSRSYRF